MSQPSKGAGLTTGANTIDQKPTTASSDGFSVRFVWKDRVIGEQKEAGGVEIVRLLGASPAAEAGTFFCHCRCFRTVGAFRGEQRSTDRCLGGILAIVALEVFTACN